MNGNPGYELHTQAAHPHSLLFLCLHLHLLSASQDILVSTQYTSTQNYQQESRRAYQVTKAGGGLNEPKNGVVGIRMEAIDLLTLILVMGRDHVRKK